MWSEEKPIGALSFLEDKSKSTFYAHITAYDKDFSKISPGSVLFIYGIKTAIENGFKSFDLSVGLEPYKLAFKPKKIDIFTVLLHQIT